MAGHKIMIAGIGLRKGAPPEDILAAVDEALAMHSKSRAQLEALATLNDKSNEQGLLSVASTLELPIIFLSPSDLNKVSHKVITNSQPSIKAKGVPSVAETAALAATGKDATLLGPRASSKTATCALASSNEGATP